MQLIEQDHGLGVRELLELEGVDDVARTGEDQFAMVKVVPVHLGVGLTAANRRLPTWRGPLTKAI